MKMKKMIFLYVMFCILFFNVCRETSKQEVNDHEKMSPEDRFRQQRLEMVDKQIVSRGVKDALVISSMRKVPRHEFIPPDLHDYAYADHPLPIGENQTISQPYIVALMTELLQLKGGEKVLEIGTGSGYQAAVLAEIAGEVYSIEIIPLLFQHAQTTLSRLGYQNIRLRLGDGYQGWPEVGPFDAIIVTAAPDHVPQPLLDQLKTGGLLVIPVGDLNQELTLLTKTEQGEVLSRSIIPVRFVPMTGQAQSPK